MGHLCSTRKKRDHPAIESGGQEFADAIHDGDYKKAAMIAVSTTLKVNGAEGLAGAFDKATSAFKRKKLRTGLV
jgi:hypothetical protein